MLRDLGGLSEARSHYRRALQIIEAQYGSHNLDAAAILNNLGNTAKAQGEPAEAHSYFERALGIFRDTLGLDHPDAAMAQEHLEMLQQELMRQDAADDTGCDYFYF
jgi:tetratricopeptide (TPR) repeat protein